MSPRAMRVVFGGLVVLIGTAVVYALLLAPVPGQPPLWLGVLCEIGVLAAGGGIAFTAPPAGYRPATTVATAEVPEPGVVSVYRGAQPPAAAPTPISKASARRLTIGILAALGFTAAAVPFALHLPRWIEAEVVVFAWWSIWSVVLAVVAYRGAKVDDDHRPAEGSVVSLDAGPAAPLRTESKPKWSWLLEGLGDPEGCAIALAVLAVVGIALLGAWLVVELLAPAVFLVAYRGVVRALAKAQQAKSRGDAVRSALSGMGWAAAFTLPLAAIVAIAHAILSA